MAAPVTTAGAAVAAGPPPGRLAGHAKGGRLTIRRPRPLCPRPCYDSGMRSSTVVPWVGSERMRSSAPIRRARSFMFSRPRLPRLL